MKIKQYIENSLIDMGLTAGETNIYYIIFQAKNDAVDAEYLRQKTRLSISGIYKIINSLVDKNYIIPIKKDRSICYVAVPLRQVSQKIQNYGRKFIRMAERFSELDRLSGVSPDSEIFEGNSMADYYLSIPHKIDDFIWCVGSFEAVMNFIGPETEKGFIRSRIKRGKKADAIIFDNSQYSKELAGRDISEKRETKILPRNNYPLQFSYLYGDTCLDFYKSYDDKTKVLKTDSLDIARARLIQYQTIWNSTNG